MAKEIKTEIQINATPDKVWAILTDFDAYPQWNPFIKSIKGPLQPGASLTVRIEPPQAKGMTFTPRVLAVSSPKELRWLGHLLFKGLFDGEHRFELVGNGDGTTTFLHSEKFSGLLVPLLKKQLDNNTLQGFRLMNEQLKQRAEAL